MSTAGKLITLEGIEGVGKSTVLRFINKILTDHLGDNFISTREPGGTPLAEKIRDLAIKPQGETVYPDTELLLMFASRAQHLNEVVFPALKTGKWVVSDRFVDASYAYQGGGREIEMHKIATLDKLVVGPLQPDLVILLDAPVEVGMTRASKRGAADRIEKEKAAFFERARKVYLDRADHEPNRYAVIDASKSLNEVEGQVRDVLSQFLNENQAAADA